MLPDERSLVARMEKRPFSIVAVNSDPLETLKKVLVSEKITWPQFFDGGSTGGPIAKAWGVTGWPTIYVIDANGVIRHKGLRGKALDDAIEKLVVETEKGGPAPVR